MSWFVAIKGPFGRKPVGRICYPTREEAALVCWTKARESGWTSEFCVLDADHEPGKSILINRGEDQRDPYERT